MNLIAKILFSFLLQISTTLLCFSTVITRPHEMLNALGNNIFRQKTGIYCAQAYACDFTGNKITNWANGIEYYRKASNSEPITYFKSNKFLDNDFGLVIADVEHPVCQQGQPCGSCSTANNINTHIYVKTECNLFDNNNIGIVGSGDIENQGTAALSAGNRFQDASQNDLNSDWAALWQSNTNIDYRRQGISNFDELSPNGGTIIGKYCLNGTSPASTKFITASGGVNTCSSLISRSIKGNSQKNQYNPGILIKPNPSKQMVELVISGVEKLDFQVYDLNGNIIKTGNATMGINKINLSDLNSGVYVFRFSNGQSEKLIILN